MAGAARARTTTEGAARAGIGTYGELLLVTVIWGGGVVAIKIAGEGFPPITASALRTALASAAYLPLLLLVPAGQPAPRARDLPWFTLLALTGFFLFNLLYFEGLRRTTATHGAIIFGANPVATAAFAALFLRERLRPVTALGVALSTGGVAVVILSSAHTTTAHGASVTGDVLLVGEMLAWVAYTLISRVVMRRFSPLQTTAYACLLGFVMLLPAALVSDFTPHALTGVPMRSWVAILYSGIVSVVLAYILWNRALLRLGATRTAVFSNLSPVWGLVLAHLIEDEALGPIHAAAAALIIGGVLLTNYRRTKDED
jgi:drug/metabolite transporter (DMT)-like permease